MGQELLCFAALSLVELLRSFGPNAHRCWRRGPVPVGIRPFWKVLQTGQEQHTGCTPDLQAVLRWACVRSIRPRG